MQPLPDEIYTAEQIRELDRRAIEDHGIPGYTLMSRAGEAAWRCVSGRWPDADHLLILCGAGNNAGDGYVLARLARARGARVSVVALVDPGTLKADAARAYRDYVDASGRITAWDAELPAGHDLIVDAILGTGLSRPLEGALRAAVDAINAAGRPVLALDVPTGLHADSGEVLGAAVRADVTITFIGLKLGFFLGRGREHTGELVYASLDVPDDIVRDLPPRLHRLNPKSIAQVLPRRPRSAHKGDHGHVLLIGGGPGMPGAIALAAEAALRAGAGLVTVATRAEHVPILVTRRPEIMATGVDGPDELEPLLERADVVAVGPGLGRSVWARALLDRGLAADRPLIVDADGLNLLAGRTAERRGGWVLTPHPGEAARLLETDAAAIQADRLGAIAGLVERYRAVAVLKGTGSLVQAPGEVPRVCDRGNPGMAVAGMGDVLTGLIAGIAAQCADLAAAARTGVLLHAMAGDAAAGEGERGMIASDLLEQLRPLLNRH